tara:strand:- start:1643 stop:2443 length:801 start_codon:yes stop_codon:yes gene_type:complete
MNKLRDLLLDVIKNEIADEKRIGIFFSGGTDSLTCLFTCLELNLKPILYTFHLENYISEDVITSQKIANYYDLELKKIIIKKNKDELVHDVKNLVKNYHINNKIRLQILYPFPHILKKVSEPLILTGLSADTLYGTNYHSKMNNVTNFNEIRKNSINSDEIDGYVSLKKMVENENKKLIAPYRNPKIIEHFLSFSWNQLNTPLQKNLSYEAFDDYFKKLLIYRESSSLPINSKINEWHETIFSSKLNKNNRKHLDEIIQDILEDRI